MIRGRTLEAVEFLYNTLEAGEMRSREVYNLALRAGIAFRTVLRAKTLIGAKARVDDGRWYTYIPEEACERKTEIMKIIETKSFGELFKKPTERWKISEDWASISLAGETAVNSEEISVPQTSGSGLHIKIGAYEFTADASFPTEKLISLLKELEAGGLC